MSTKIITTLCYLSIRDFILEKICHQLCVELVDNGLKFINHKRVQEIVAIFLNMAVYRISHTIFYFVLVIQNFKNDQSYWYFFKNDIRAIDSI
ncbi:hypothetical protein CR513_36128, partial [Mucuna pruriens]